MWMNQKTVFLPGTWAPASLKETDVDRQEEKRGGAECMPGTQMQGEQSSECKRQVGC